MSSFQEIESFWTTYKRLVYFGLSRRKAFPNQAFHLLQQSGYDLIPIHPDAPTIDGIHTLSSIESIDPIPQAAAIITGQTTTLHVLETCAANGIKHVFIQREGWSKSADEFCRSHQIHAVHNCVLLYHKQGFPHNLHRWLQRTFGS